MPTHLLMGRVARRAMPVAAGGLLGALLFLLSLDLLFLASGNSTPIVPFCIGGMVAGVGLGFHGVACLAARGRPRRRSLLDKTEVGISLGLVSAAFGFLVAAAGT